MINHTESFVRILNRIGKDRFLCDPGTSIGALFSDGMDPVDYEMAITSFELTHDRLFDPKLWELSPEETASLTVADLIKIYLSDTGADDELYAAERLIDLRDSIIESSGG